MSRNELIKKKELKSIQDIFNKDYMNYKNIRFGYVDNKNYIAYN